ncbi:hypothetical protein SLA2020_284720 [Shorea laevis]
MTCNISITQHHVVRRNSITAVSLAMAALSLSYSSIAWAASTHTGVQPDVHYSPKASTTTGSVFNFFSALGDVAFAYAGHNVSWRSTQPYFPHPKSPPRNPCGKA